MDGAGPIDRSVDRSIDRASDRFPVADADLDPFPGGTKTPPSALAQLLGSLIALLTLVLPAAAVVSFSATLPGGPPLPGSVELKGGP
jgi:hypothetical protein